MSLLRDLMIVARRCFGMPKLPQAVEWRSANRSAYIAKDTAHAIGRRCSSAGSMPREKRLPKSAGRSFPAYARMGAFAVADVEVSIVRNLQVRRPCAATPSRRQRSRTFPEHVLTQTSQSIRHDPPDRDLW